MDFADALHLGRSHCDGFAIDRKFVKAAKANGYESVQEV